tara:strand:+ start:1201 stop:1464 length:264 start_codon:yes stop_codon:yes gene_type:complete
MTNLYIDQGIEQDAQNDQNVILELRTRVGHAIIDAQKLRDAGAMAYYDELLTDVIDKLDDILADVIQPIEDKIDEGLRYYEANTDAA